MMKMKRTEYSSKQFFYAKRCFFLFFFLIISANAFSQSISLNDRFSQEYVRRKQLEDSSFYASTSFCIGNHNYSMFTDSVLNLSSLQNRFIKSISTSFNKKNNSFFWLPVSVAQQYNSHHAYGWNDGAMIPSHGYQVFMSAGIYFQSGHFSVQLQPEFVYTPNNPFETFHSEYNDGIWYNYYQLLNRIDMPEQFGNKSYYKILPGQSSIRYNTKSVSFGISTENLYWGPGIRNSLVMSNNAPGFLHATINTIKPIKTSIGSFELQIIAGKLNESGIALSDTNRYYNNVRLYQPKINQWRYLTGLALTWQPKWTKGLFLGMTKASYQYHTDISGIADILPLQGIIKSNSESQGKKASLGSIFMRYVFPEENAELYAEYGRNDKWANIVNLVADKNYPRGYIVGIRKLSNLFQNKSRIEFAAEITQLELPTISLINQSKSWYLNDYVRQGYTNYGQVMGAGIGPGGNSQTIDISWVKGFSKVGLLFERVVHNNDFYYAAFGPLGDYARHWIDLSTTLHADWRYKRFTFSSELSLIRSLNYEWWRIDIPSTPNYFADEYDVLNFHGKLSFSYRL